MFLAILGWIRTNGSAVLGVLLLTACVRAETITLVADQWCPYNCDPAAERPGFMVEIAQRAFAAEGIEVVYLTLPWLRALQATAHGSYDAVIGASVIEARGFVFPDIEQARMRNGIWALQGRAWQYAGVDSLKQVRLGATGGYSYGPAVERYLNHPDNAAGVTLLFGDEPLSRGISMLKRGRLDALLEDEQVMRYALRQSGEENALVLAGLVENTDEFSKIYIAFSSARENSDKYARILSEQTRRLRQSGELHDILAHYNLTDWQPSPMPH
ncbi:substrate-binding periplasmic protein [Gilvimarinus algae]|uniref:Transporter substrate-binding domain-containing protein n=1 Tax=Gilvimarinus algae TaxID=3058037 RepID=A0ABT8TAW0_9GAMM|nr:transporter substrate-binding domain-containing protein [Gilvimarinus sp. SDUM040014]MDO3381260.1 transporter substrate-binding domain-containing protein [Gilvimarinus sp. SDUM040014]